MNVTVKHLRSVQILVDQFKTLTDLGEVLYSYDSPARRSMGFVCLSTGIFYCVQPSHFHECTPELRAPLENMVLRRAYFGEPPLDPRVGEITLAIDPPRPTIPRAELRAGLVASGLPEWVQELLFGEAETRGIFPS